MSEQHQVVAGRDDRSIAVLVACAVSCALVLLLTYVVIFNHEKRAIISRRWVEHTHDVIEALDRESRLINQLRADQRFLKVAKDGDVLDGDQKQALSLESGALRLQKLVSDNPRQSGRVQELLHCTTQLREATPTVAAFESLDSASFAECYQAISLMKNEEDGLLLSRSAQAQRNNESTLWGGIGDAIFSFVGMLGLFGFLIRGAVYRKRLGSDLLRANDDLSYTVEKLERNTVSLQLLTIVRDELQLCVTLKEAQDSTAHYLSQLLPNSSGAICLTNESRNLVERVACWGDAPRMEAVPEVFPPEDCCGLRSGRPRWQYAGESEVRCTHFVGAGPRHYVCLPLTAQGEALGFVTIDCADEQELRDLEQDGDSVRQIVELAAVTVASLKLRMKLQNQSIRDSLTDLYNRSFMEIAFERELRRASRKQNTLAVFMLDIDHFKKFNDSLGHAAGDAVLREVAGVFRKLVRSEDISCRYGGEEFAIILPDISLEIATARAEAIRQAVSEMSVWVHGERLPEVTISIGIAMHPTDGESAEQLLRSADQALYRAKRSGRNRVVLAEAPVRV